MSGIYIHIPFCRKKCFYCDFYKTTSLKYKDDFIKALYKEIKIKDNFLQDKNIDTIYFGGGTPTLLTINEIENILDEIYSNFSINSNPEITFEANPDDLNKHYLQNLIKTPVNRLSIGIQSFFDDDLKLMNRRHNAGEAINAVKEAQNQGFTNISGDLIYGLPNMTGEKWQKNMNIFFDLEMQHLSAYHLSYEENTIFYKFLKSGKLSEVEEDKSNEFFTMLIEESAKRDFIHYEISNLAKSGYFSRHNSSYWQQKEYLGLGPSAHSYNIKKREWNISNVEKYISRIGEGQLFYENEELDDRMNYNDYIITSLRTIWGSDITYIKENYGKKYSDFCLYSAKKYLAGNFLTLSSNKLILEKKGKFISDKIIEDLFYARN